MANGVFNIARGKIGYYLDDAMGLTAANSRLTIVVLSLVEADDTLNNYDTLAAVIAGANTEADATNYARIELAAAAVTLSVDDGTNTAKVVIDADQTWTSVANDDSNGGWDKLLICWDGDNAAGTDANVVPLTYHDFSVTPNGGNITADFDQTNGIWGSS
jgi:hypothetical protein